MTQPQPDPVAGSGFPSPSIVSSRRLMGPNLLCADVGAVLDVSLSAADGAQHAQIMSAWHVRVLHLAAELNWPTPQLVERVYEGGASLFFTAPVDQLMCATEVNERAWVFAEQCVAGTATGDANDELSLLREMSRAELNPKFAAIWIEAQRRRVNVTFDETSLAVGTGCGAQIWPMTALPEIDKIPWDIVLDVPIVLVTGSNGKTTVVRMVAAMARAAGHTVGYTCTDGVWIDGAQVESGDYSGPAGARRVLHDPTVTLAVLETARGGILRRGLALQHAEVAAVVTLSADHFGDYGIMDLESLAAVKLVTTHAVRTRGTLVVNADVPELANAVSGYSGQLARVSINDAASDTSLAEIPATLAGTATHNVINALVARQIAAALHLGPAANDALMRFGADPRDNVGRLMRRDLYDVRVVVDYAHNPQSVRALIDGTRSIQAQRRAIILGTGGDRDDIALHDIATAAFNSGIIDLYIAKEMPRFLRGRPPGTLSAAIITTLRKLGVAESQIVNAPDDIAAVRHALRWAQPGDLLLLGVHDKRDTILTLLDSMHTLDWRAGDMVPEIAQV